MSEDAKTTPGSSSLIDLFSMMVPVSTNSPFAAQWRRMLAFLVDGALLSLLCAVLIFCCFTQLAALGEWGRGIGFLLAIGYFAIGNSRLTAGQTVGKRLLRIRAVDLAGQVISPQRSLLRAIIPAWILVMRDINISAGFTVAVIVTLINLASYSLLLFELYMFVFDRPCRRTLHDYIAGSAVVNKAAENPLPTAEKLTKFHHFILALGLLLLSAIAAQTIYQAWHDSRFEPQAQGKLRGIAGVYSAAVMPLPPQKGRPAMFLVSVSTHKQLTEDYNRQLFPQMARVMIRYYPAVLKHERIVLSARYGVHLGIANWAPPVNYLRSPAQLRAIAKFVDK